MAIFDYKGEDARELIAEAYGLTAYSSGQAFTLGLFDKLGALVPSIVSTSTPPEGWRELTPRELGLDDSRLDITGSYKGEGPTFDGLFSSQAKVLGKFDDAGNLTKVSFNIAATSTPFVTDIIDYIPMFDNSYIDSFNYLLDALKDYSTSNGLSGEDVIVTGYSLGAGVANGMYQSKDEKWGGFYAESDYITGASPKIADSDGIYNIGFENDVVFRTGGTADNWIDGAISALTGNDTPYRSTTDNIVLFDDVYATPLWPYGPFSILNPTGWAAHLEGALFNPVERIMNSTFYDSIERDSTIVLSHLSDLTRPFVWVQDKDASTSDHFGTPAFLLGGEKGDKLSDGRSDDFLDGFAGNDEFRLTTGTDVVAGGAGKDKAAVLGNAGDYEAIRTSDGTVFLYDTTGKYGLKELSGVEEVVFAGNVHGILDSTYQVTPSKLDGFLWNDVSYSAAREGGAGNDTLTGTGGRDRLFGQGGDDQLSAGAGNDLVHGGAGNDVLRGEAGNDALYGGAGNDLLDGGAGNDFLSGGVGSDRFVFTGTAFGSDTVSDFGIHENGHDTLGFSADLFANVEDILAAARQVGSDTVITHGSNSVTLIGLQRAELTTNDLFII